MVMIMRVPSLKPVVSSCMCVCDGNIQNLNRLCRSQIRTDARINLLGGGKGGQLRANCVPADFLCKPQGEVVLGTVLDPGCHEMTFKARNDVYHQEKKNRNFLRKYQHLHLK